MNGNGENQTAATPPPGGALVVSYYPVQDEASGGRRRIGELLRALAPHVRMLQPVPLHPAVAGAAFPVDFGRRKIGINWGMFNLYWPANRRIARKCAAEWKPSVVISTSIWCHSAFDGMGLPRVLDAQNVDAAAVAERFGDGHPFTRRVRAAEARVVREVEKICCCSAVDAERFQRDYGVPSEKLVVVPNGVRLSADPVVLAPEAAELRARDAGKTILYFMGKMDYAPNVQAMEFITRELLPELERREPGRYVCWVSGGPALPPGVTHPALRYLGLVPAVLPWLAAADVALAPVETGGGTRLKVLEYLGAQKPMVATPKAVEGVNLRDGVDARLVSLPAFADAVQWMAGHRAEAAAIAAAGLETVRANYTWEASARRWRAALAPYGF